VARGESEWRVLGIKAGEGWVDAETEGPENKEKNFSSSFMENIFIG